MRFHLDTSGVFYNEEEKDKLEKLGFEFKEPERTGAAYRKLPSELYIDFNSLDELVTLVAEYGKAIIQPPHEDGWDWNIEIYDNYRE
ncbi:MAG: hypothetical protein ACYSW6_11695 [Planctomycetota bacterium]|jgi:hypothetical protein